MQDKKTQIDRTESEVTLETVVSPEITVDWHDIGTTCNCGRPVILKPLYSWMVADCKCGRNIRMNADRSRMIIDFSKTITA